MQARLIPFLFAAVLSAGCATTFPPQPLKLLGMAAPSEAAIKTIVLTPETAHVNVTGGEVIRFVAGNKTFAWSFDGPLQVSRVDLMRVAPPGFLDHPVIAYIAPNPMYIGRDE
jgi:hypothetical protein